MEQEITEDSHVMGEFVGDWLHPRLLGQWFFRSLSVTLRSYDLRVYDVSQLPQLYNILAIHNWHTEHWNPRNSGLRIPRLRPRFPAE